MVPPGPSATTLPRRRTLRRAALRRMASIGSAASSSTIAAGIEAIAVEVENPGRRLGDRLETCPHGLNTGHLPDMERHGGNVQHVARAHRVPGVHHAIMAEGDGHAGRHQFRDPRHAAALRIGIVPPLDGDVDERVGDRRHTAFGDLRNELADIIIVHRMHRGEMRAGDTALHPQPVRLRRQRLDMARHGIIGLVTMHVDQQASLGGKFTQRSYRGSTISHGALKMWDTAHDIDTAVECCLQELDRTRAAQIAVLGKSHQLQIEIWLHALLYFEERIHCQQSRVTNVDMAADGEQAARHRPVAVTQRPRHDRFLGKMRLQLTPELDAFEQRTRPVEPRQPQAQSRIHVEMRIDERRAHQQAARLDGCFAGIRQAGFDGDDLLAADADIDSCAPVGQGCVPDDEIEHWVFTFPPCDRGSSRHADNPRAAPW